MGIDFTALIDHQLSWDDLYRLPALLRESWPTPAQVLIMRDDLPRSAEAWRWSPDPNYSNVAEELFEQRHLVMDGPCGFSLTVFHHAVEVHHLCRWWGFVSEPEIRDALRAACRALAQTLRATTIVYIPDNAAASDTLFDRASLLDVLASLEGTLGPPIDLDRLPDDDHRVYALERLAGAG
jgi:hypothetical protein